MNINKLEQLVKESGMSKVEIAKKCGISRVTLDNALQGADIRVSILTTLAKVLNFNVGELFGEDYAAAVTNIENTQDATGYRLVPLCNLDARGGFANNEEVGTEYTISYYPFKNAKSDDICIPISGDSMSPTYKPGSIVLLHPIPEWYDFLEMGQVYVIELQDERRIIKELRSCPNCKDKFLCISHNPNYDSVELPKKLIKRVFLVTAMYSKTTL